ncbi:MAG: hypothetical protein EBZ18_01195 [Alphaproteobacteria bacterium]|nr:hypothetical protein [Alphaproteobacteria bacterium]
MRNPHHSRWFITCGCLFIATILPQDTGRAFGQTTETLASETLASDSVIDAESQSMVELAVTAVVSHPNVAAARANICSAASNFDLAESRQYPQISFDLHGIHPLTHQKGRRQSLFGRNSICPTT